MRIFRYLPEVDAFELTPEYAEFTKLLDMDAWWSVAWIGRLFSLDNDVGEHWLDGWGLREQRSELAARHGRDAETLLILDPRRLADGADGPCHTDEFRARFWRDVLQSLDLGEELIIDEAREYCRLDATPADLDAFENRVTTWRRSRAGRLH